MVNNKDPPLLSRPAGVCFGFWAFSLYFRSPMVQSHPDYRGACSLPAIDHDSRTRYTIFTWTGGRWEFSRSWVPYEVGQELAALRTCGLPLSNPAYVIMKIRKTELKSWHIISPLINFSYQTVFFYARRI